MNIQKKGWGLPGRGLAYRRMRWNWNRYHAGVGSDQGGLGSAWRDPGRKGGALVGRVACSPGQSCSRSCSLQGTGAGGWATPHRDTQPCGQGGRGARPPWGDGPTRCLGCGDGSQGTHFKTHHAVLTEYGQLTYVSDPPIKLIV